MAKWLALLFCALTCVHAYVFYKEELPNGDRVPHPCKANYQWPGVGHKNELGSGARNPFGIDFAAAGRKWTTELCNKDSDGDGKSNGVELGDPNCVWSKGGIPEKADGLSHPGVCEPIDSANCKAANDWDFCSIKEFSCNATNNADVERLKVTLDQTNVPAQETTYICQHFKIPTDKDYHVIAYKPEIDNNIVMHHILLFGCKSGGNYQLNDAHDCGMSNGDCSEQIGGWSVGDVGTCLPDDLGVLIGKNSGYSHVMLQLHWNNPQKLSTYKDKSGLTLYLTPNLRQQSSAVFTIGQMQMNIPPGQVSYEATATCRPFCTSRVMQEPFFIWSATVHMHYLGRHGTVEQWRNGTKIATIVDTPDYSYDRPEASNHQPPLKFEPGDEMRLRCEYKSTSRNTITYYGDGTQDEMCFGFIGVYPVSAVKQFQGCIDFGSVDLCEAAINNFTNTKIGECDIPKHFEELTTIGTAMWVPCKGLQGECPPACKKYVDSTLKKNPCRQEPALDFFNRIVQVDFIRQLEITTAACDEVVDDDSSSSTVFGVSVMSALLPLAALMFHI